VRQQPVQFYLAQHAPQRGLRKLRGLVNVVRNFHYRLRRIHHAHRDDGIDFNGDIVLRDHVLRRHFHHFLPQRNPHNLIQWPEYENEPRALRRKLNASQPENHAAFVLTQNFDAVQEIEDNDRDDNENGNAWHK